jgi:transcription initiation factor IIE alpha subunit
MLERVKVVQDEEWVWAAEAEWAEVAAAVTVVAATEAVEDMAVVVVKVVEDVVEVAEEELSEEPGTYSNTRRCR